LKKNSDHYSLSEEKVTKYFSSNYGSLQGCFTIADRKIKCQKKKTYHALKIFERMNNFLREGPIKREKRQQKTKINSEFEGSKWHLRKNCQQEARKRLDLRKVNRQENGTWTRKLAKSCRKVKEKPQDKLPLKSNALFSLKDSCFSEYSQNDHQASF